MTASCTFRSLNSAGQGLEPTTTGPRCKSGTRGGRRPCASRPFYGRARRRQFPSSKSQARQSLLCPTDGAERYTIPVDRRWPQLGQPNWPKMPEILEGRTKGRAAVLCCLDVCGGGQFGGRRKRTRGLGVPECGMGIVDFGRGKDKIRVNRRKTTGPRWAPVVFFYWWVRWIY
jgi:hypothetical protein